MMDSTVVERKTKFIPCPHGKRRWLCQECGGASICCHGKRRPMCKECGGTSICEHGKLRNICRDCEGSCICEHGKRRQRCKVCHGVSICEHGRERRVCKECHGAAICEHGAIRNCCRACDGACICEHGKRRGRCQLCGGGSLCEHGREKSQCKECGGSSICEHGKRKNYCKECRGASICEHQRCKAVCPDCEGRRICKSRREPYNTGCRSQGNRKLTGFCCHCFVNLFPEDPRCFTVRRKSKEMQVVSHIASKFDGFVHDKPFYVDLQGGCCATKRRVDLRKLISNTMLCIEIDEDQHKSYIKQRERDRYDDLFMDFTGKYIFIRYNPDRFIDKYQQRKNPFFETRMEALESAIARHIGRIEREENEDLLEIHHLFYDEC